MTGAFESWHPLAYAPSPVDVAALASSRVFADDPHNVVIDLSDSHIWDASTVAALDAVTTKYRAKGKVVEIVGLNTDSADRHDRLSGTLGSES